MGDSSSGMSGKYLRNFCGDMFDSDHVMMFFEKLGPAGYVLGTIAALVFLCFIVFYFAASANLGQEIGRKKGFTAGWLWGLLMGPIGILLLMVRPAKNQSNTKGGTR